MQNLVFCFPPRRQDGQVSRQKTHAWRGSKPRPALPAISERISGSDELFPWNVSEPIRDVHFLWPFFCGSRAPWSAGVFSADMCAASVTPPIFKIVCTMGKPGPNRICFHPHALWPPGGFGRTLREPDMIFTSFFIAKANRKAFPAIASAKIIIQYLFYSCQPQSWHNLHTL